MTDRNSGIPEHEQHHQDIYQQRPYPPPGYYHPSQNQKKRFPAVKAIVATVAIVVPTVVVALLYIMVVGLAPGGCGCAIPVGEFGDVELVGPTSVNVDFGKISGEPRPVDLLVVLEWNLWTEGRYSFGNNGDGELILSDGPRVGTIMYVDLYDNWKVNIGDQLKITDLEPDSSYIIRLYWVPTGDLITSTSFSTTP